MHGIPSRSSEINSTDFSKISSIWHIGIRPILNHLPLYKVEDTKSTCRMKAGVKGLLVQNLCLYASKASPTSSAQGLEGNRRISSSISPLVTLWSGLPSWTPISLQPIIECIPVGPEGLPLFILGVILVETICSKGRRTLVWDPRLRHGCFGEESGFVYIHSIGGGSHSPPTSFFRLYGFLCCGCSGALPDFRRLPPLLSGEYLPFAVLLCNRGHVCNTERTFRSFVSILSCRLFPLDGFR